MTFKIYMTVELPGEYADKESAMDSAVDALRDKAGWHDEAVVTGRAIECRVFESDKIMHAGNHDFIIDICDGAI